MNGAPHNAWDTPPDGDFASYVERLSATPPRGNAAPHHLGAAPAPVAAPHGAPRPYPRLGRAVNPPGLLGALRAARVVVAVLAVGQVMALFILDWGFPLLLFVAALVWTVLSAMIRSLVNPLGALEGALSESQPLPSENERPLAHPRKTGNQ